MPRGARAGLVALVLVAGVPVPAAGQGPQTSDPAQQRSRVDRERDRLVDRYDETLAAEADQVAAYEESRATAAALARQLVVLDRNVVSVQQDLTRANTTAATARRHRDTVRDDLRRAQDQLDHRRAELRAMAVSGYVWFGERGRVHTPYGQSVTAEEQLLARFYSGYLDDLEGDRVHAVEVQQRRVARLVSAADRASAGAEAARRGVATRKAELQQARDRQAAAKAAADVEVERQHRLVAEVQARRGDYERQLDALAAESAALGDLLRAHEAGITIVAPKPVAQPRRPARTAGPPSATRPTTPKPPGRPPPTRPPSPSPDTTAHQTSTTNNAGSGPPPPIPIHLSYPLPGYPVVSGYGWRIHPILGVRKLHEGIDIAAPMGTPIHAAAAGTVIWAGPRNGYGNAVIIDHGSGVGTVYAHQSRVGVAVGQRVSAGQVIGYVGQTGLAASPHCHFEVRIGGHTYDPLAYVHPS